MLPLALRTTTSKGFTFHDIQPFVRPPAGPGGTCRLLAVVLAADWLGGPPFFLQEFTRY